jgi:hypothetical protein
MKFEITERLFQAGKMKFQTSTLFSTNDITFEWTALHFPLPAYPGATEGLKWPRARTTDTQRELFFKKSKAVGLGRQIGLKYFEAFGVFSVKILALFWNCESLVQGKV